MISPPNGNIGLDYTGHPPASSETNLKVRSCTNQPPWLNLTHCFPWDISYILLPYLILLKWLTCVPFRNHSGVTSRTVSKYSATSRTKLWDLLSQYLIDKFIFIKYKLFWKVGPKLLMLVLYSTISEQWINLLMLVFHYFWTMDSHVNFSCKLEPQARAWKWQTPLLPWLVKK